MTQHMRVRTGFDEVASTIHQSLMDSARHVTECHVTQEMRVRAVCDEVASTIHQSLLLGLCYIVLVSPYLLPKGKTGKAASSGDQETGGRQGEDLIVGARVQPWSAAVGKTVAGSGLRGLPGLYLVSVKRDDVLMRAVGPEFILTQGRACTIPVHVILLLGPVSSACLIIVNLNVLSSSSV